ncbi:MAG: hypothetical protein R3253_02500 [Longimicrobiales bacterium]|nr:hypothetical protein [Longimicrobiales bacterium]
MFARKNTPFTLGAALLAVFGVACQDEAPATGLADVAETIQASHNAAPGSAQLYQASFSPLNADLSFRPVRGQATVRVADGQLSVMIEASGLEPGIPHPQHIHGFLGAGPGACPTLDADRNEDGIIDVLEGVPDYGGILVTLDSDLTDGAGTQVEGLPTTSNQGGTIRYTMTAPLSEVVAGAGAADAAELDLGNRHIVLHGVNPETELGTAASIGGLPAWLTLPVACGQLFTAGR